MPDPMVFENSIVIQASLTQVDRCITEEPLMSRWLNPLLKCESIGSWAITEGSRFRFIIQIPVWHPSLDCVVQERQVGLVVWGFQGFFVGSDRWQCQAQDADTLLTNRFEFEIPDPVVRLGFEWVAKSLTQRDMRQQLVRLKGVAESLSS